MKALIRKSKGKAKYFPVQLCSKARKGPGLKTKEGKGPGLKTKEGKICSGERSAYSSSFILALVYLDKAKALEDVKKSIDRASDKVLNEIPSYS